MDERPIGRVIGTESKPNTAYRFYFWAPLDARIGIGSLVVVRHGELRVWGVVEEGHGYNDAQTPFYDYLGFDGDPNALPPTQRPEMRLYEAAVLRRDPDSPVQPVPIAPVYLSSGEDVSLSLRMDDIPEARRIPVGAHDNDGVISPICVDADFLIGPEAGHLNVTGASGLAAKTSAIQFVLASLFQKAAGSLAVVCFNVKGGDLLFLDQPPAEALPEEDLKIYEAVGIDPKPFEKVRYYAPFREDLVNLASLRTHPDLVGDVRPLQWGLREVMRYAEITMNRDDVDARADAFLSFLRQRVVDPGEYEFDDGFKLPVTNFDELKVWFDRALREIEQSRDERWHSHAVQTIRKVFNRVNNLTVRYAGLVSSGNETLDLPWGEFEDRAIYAIDMANLRAEAQDLIFTRVISELRERMENQDLGVDRVVVVVDELNQYAESSGQETYILRTLRDICARGRYLGLTLFGAQQFRSRIDRQIVGNCSTAFYGRSEMEELAQAPYQIFTPAIKEKLGTLRVGEMLVRHPYFAQPVWARFPRPPVMSGKDGMAKYPPERLPFADAVVARLRAEYPNLRPNEVYDALSGRQNDQAAVNALVKTLSAKPKPDEALRFFASRLGKAIVETSAQPPIADYPTDDPTSLSEDDPFK